jgi:hypothetical protein
MYVYINNKCFEVVASKDLYAHLLNNRVNYYYDDIYDAYARPSQEKRDIFFSWLDWVNELEETSDKINFLYDLKITGRNSNTFSLTGWVNISDIYIVIYITKSHNRAVVVGRERAKELYKLLEAK